ncbi:MAG: hypothetical protein AB1391_03925 [Candidatus Micrarchaeota archaeon]
MQSEKSQLKSDEIRKITESITQLEKYIFTKMNELDDRLVKLELNISERKGEQVKG